MSKTVIKIENLSKIYRLGEVGTGTLSHDLNRFWKMNILGQDDPYAKIGQVNDRTAKAHKGEMVAALRDINLEVKEGEVLGIIGRNGAGKSTLLKILSRVTSPTTGSIRVKGRMASLLEVGTGFHPEMTGRENIYMNGTIMGMRRWEIDRKLDEIVEFAGVAKYLDTPTKRYSSGMTVRLGFAIAAHLEPEILVVDEVLAVGDAEFQKKAIGKMQDVSTNEGRTVLFVSHNMASMQQLCNTGHLLQYGSTIKTGSIGDVISFYQTQNRLNQSINLEDRKDRNGNGRIVVKNYRILNEKGEVLDRVIAGSTFIIQLELFRNDTHYTPTNLNVSLSVNNSFGQKIIVLSNLFHKKNIIFPEKYSKVKVDFRIERCPLNQNDYGLTFFVSDNDSTLDWIDDAGNIIVEAGDFYNTGIVNNERLGTLLIDYGIEAIY